MTYNPVTATEGRKMFGVCSKGLDFPTVDLSARIVEWLEVLRALGAEMVSIYTLDVHPNIQKVLDHYSREGYLQVTPLSLPDYQPNLPWLRHKFMEKHRNKVASWQYELIALNDCFYRRSLRQHYWHLLVQREITQHKRK